MRVIPPPAVCIQTTTTFHSEFLPNNHKTLHFAIFLNILSSRNLCNLLMKTSTRACCIFSFLNMLQTGEVLCCVCLIVFMHSFLEVVVVFVCGLYSCTYTCIECSMKLSMSCACVSICFECIHQHHTRYRIFMEAVQGHQQGDAVIPPNLHPLNYKHISEP